MRSHTHMRNFTLRNNLNLHGRAARRTSRLHAVPSLTPGNESMNAIWWRQTGGTRGEQRLSAIPAAMSAGKAYCSSAPTRLKAKTRYLKGVFVHLIDVPANGSRRTNFACLADHEEVAGDASMKVSLSEWRASVYSLTTEFDIKRARSMRYIDI